MPDTPASRDPARKDDAKPAEIPAERSETTSGEIVAGGVRVPYEITASTLHLRGKDDKPTAEIFSIAYRRTDIEDSAERPVTFCFNGGPGSSSVWLHLGAFGPKRVEMPDPHHPPPPPWRLVDNPHTLLDATDLVFIDPVGTGFSRPVGEGRGEDFWGVDADTASVGQFIERWLSRHGRWTSPRYLMGESYGTTRAVTVAWWLSERGIPVNGLGLVSAALHWQTFVNQGINDLALAAFLPTIGMTAAWHGRAEGADPNALADRLREFTWRRYAPALHLGDALPQSERDAMAAELAALTGLDAQAIAARHLRVDPMWFAKQLLPGAERTIGRLDSRYTGHDAAPDEATIERDPSYDAALGPFTACINHLLRREIGWETDHMYEVLSLDVNKGWKFSREGWLGFIDVGADLKKTMCANPHLRVLFCNGLYDLATPFAASEYTARHLALPEPLRGNITERSYPAGHMMYFHPPSLLQLNDDLRSFVTP